MAVLYRKYRPQTFADVVGQSHIVQTLKNQVAGGSIAHAYLFTGSRGVGKTSIARILAKAVNCEHSKKGEPDGTCEICTQITQGNFVDLIEIDAASNTGVDNIRDLIDHVKFSPSAGAYKVFIIDEVHMLSKGAFNALLKTLEEPPAHAIFILATTEINKVPATIISRTQRFDFKRASNADLTTHLEFVSSAEKHPVPQEILELIAMRAEGGLRDALSLLDKVLTLGKDPSLSDAQQLLGVTPLVYSERLFMLITQGSLAGIPPFFEELMETGTDMYIFNRDFLEYLRSALIFKVVGSGNGRGFENAELLAAVPLSYIMLVIRLFLKSYKDLQSAPSPELPLLLSALEAASKHASGGDPIAAAPVAKIVLHNPAPVVSTTSIEPVTPPVSEFVFTHILEPSVGVENFISEEPVKRPVDVSVNLAEVEPLWLKVVDKVKAVNGPLGNLLSTSPIKQVKDGIVYVGVKYLFHKQNLENTKNNKLISESIISIFGKPLGLSAQVIKIEEKPIEGAASALAEALSMFGGEVVE